MFEEAISQYDWKGDEKLKTVINDDTSEKRNAGHSLEWAGHAYTYSLESHTTRNSLVYIKYYPH